ncbi:MAG: hypothetical protein LBK95_14170 [Bifidobacteriaceae bacterium]|jgi:hypothetical protein|nr:hypothetical protein [Bifidobacteriaceae bacterium]
MTKRISLILDDAVKSEVWDFVARGTPAREALATWAKDHDLGPLSSDASVWRPLLQIGARTVREAALEDGSGRLSDYYSETEPVSERRAARDRHVRRTEAKLRTCFGGRCSGSTWGIPAARSARP